MKTADNIHKLLSTLFTQCTSSNEANEQNHSVVYNKNNFLRHKKNILLQVDNEDSEVSVSF